MPQLPSLSRGCRRLVTPVTAIVLPPCHFLVDAYRTPPTAVIGHCHCARCVPLSALRALSAHSIGAARIILTTYLGLQ